jgi:hypothetical protein
MVINLGCDVNLEVLSSIQHTISLSSFRNILWIGVNLIRPKLRYHYFNNKKRKEKREAKTYFTFFNFDQLSF